MQFHVCVYRVQVITVLCVQHYVTVLSSLVVFPLVVASVLCVPHDWVAMSQIMSTTLFITGIATLLQCLLGCRSVTYTLFSSPPSHRVDIPGTVRF